MQVETVVSVAVLSVLTVLIGAQVFLRYLFSSPFTWSEELRTPLLITYIPGFVLWLPRLLFG